MATSPEPLPQLPPDSASPLHQLQQQVHGWINTIGVRYYSPLTNTAILAEEVGEVARLMARLHGDQSFKPGQDGSELPEEMADVLFVLLALANQTGTDLQAAWDYKMAKKTERDAERHRNNPKLKAE